MPELLLLVKQKEHAPVDSVEVRTDKELCDCYFVELLGSVAFQCDFDNGEELLRVEEAEKSSYD